MPAQMNFTTEQIDSIREAFNANDHRTGQIDLVGFRNVYHRTKDSCALIAINGEQIRELFDRNKDYDGEIDMRSTMQALDSIRSAGGAGPNGSRSALSRAGTIIGKWFGVGNDEDLERWQHTMQQQVKTHGILNLEAREAVPGGEILEQGGAAVRRRMTSMRMRRQSVDPATGQRRGSNATAAGSSTAQSRRASAASSGSNASAAVASLAAVPEDSSKPVSRGFSLRHVKKNVSHSSVPDATDGHDSDDSSVYDSVDEEDVDSDEDNGVELAATRDGDSLGGGVEDSRRKSVSFFASAPGASSASLGGGVLTSPHPARFDTSDKGSRDYVNEDWFGNDDEATALMTAAAPEATMPTPTTESQKSLANMSPTALLEASRHAPVGVSAKLVREQTLAQGVKVPAHFGTAGQRHSAMPQSAISAGAAAGAMSPSAPRPGMSPSAAAAAVPHNLPKLPASTPVQPRPLTTEEQRRRRQRMARDRRPARVRRMDTFVQKQILAMPEYKPYFIYIVSLIQLILIIVEMSVGGIAPIGFGTQSQFATVPSLLQFTGTTDVSKVIAENFWIGPDTEFLIRFGAKYTPCMRRDNSVYAYFTERNNAFLQYKCCRNTNTDTCGMAATADCPNGNAWLTVSANADEVCSVADPVNCTPEKIILRPCCYTQFATCSMISASECQFYGGTFYSTMETCTQIDSNCLSATCGMGMSLEPTKPNQAWRFFTPIFLHVGFLHFLFNVLFQWSIGKAIERQAGFLRIFIIYMLSGFGGNVVSAVFVPYSAQVGASGALYGLLGVLIVELFQSWQLLDNPWSELFKLLIIVGLSLMIGTLPWVDNFAHVGGFIVGLFAAVVFLPYIVFGKWDRRRKRFLLMICFPILIVFFGFFIIIFYTGRQVNFCPWCSYINCVPYTSTICEGVNSNTNPYD